MTESQYTEKNRISDLARPKKVSGWGSGFSERNTCEDQKLSDYRLPKKVSGWGSGFSERDTHGGEQ